MKNKTLPTQKKLAASFIRKMRGSLSVANLKKVDASNAKETNPNVCHSGDFIDSNMVMLEAWDSLTTTDFSLQNKAHLAKWNAAWDMAKKQGFSRAKDRK
jgi:hypothetical protein